MLVAGLTNPLDFATAKDGTGRLFIVEQGGTIRIIQRGALLPGPFLNITNLVEWGGEERPSTSKAPTASLPPLPLRLLPGGANQFPGGSFTR